MRRVQVFAFLTDNVNKPIDSERKTIMAPHRRVLDDSEVSLRDHLLNMSQLAEQAIANALRCYLEHDQPLAQEIIAGDRKVNELQHLIVESCISTVALQQPVAHDLRALLADMYLANELERIADHAADIARIVLKRQAKPAPEFGGQVDDMAQQCRSMLERIMAAYERQDMTAARDIAAEDDIVDAAEKRLVDDIFNRVSEGGDEFLEQTYNLWIIHNLERIGDRVTNIAEHIVYMVTSEKVDLNE
jgi:phosphate transport system protein